MAPAKKTTRSTTKRKKAGDDPAIKIAVGVMVLSAVSAVAAGGYWFMSRGNADAPAVVKTAAVAPDSAQKQVDAARAQLFAVIEQHQIPTVEEWHKVLEMYRGALAQDATYAAATAGIQLTDGGLDVVEGRFQPADEKLSGVMGEPEEVLAGYMLGHLKLRTGAAQDAWGEFGLILKTRPEWLPARLGQFLADLELDDLKLESCPMLAQAVTTVALTPSLAGAHAYCLERGNDPAAAEWYAKAFAMGARDRRVLEGHIGRLVEAGDFDTVKSSIEEAVAKAGEPITARIGFAELLRNAHQSALALEQCETAFAANPQSVEASVCVAAAAVEASDPTAAVARIDQLITSFPELPDLQLYRAYALGGAGRGQEANEIFKKICAKSGYLPACREACLKEQLSVSYDPRYSTRYSPCAKLDAKEQMSLRKQAQEMNATERGMNQAASEREWDTRQQEGKMATRESQERYQRESQQRQQQYSTRAVRRAR